MVEHLHFHKLTTNTVHSYHASQRTPISFFSHILNIFRTIFCIFFQNVPTNHGIVSIFLEIMAFFQLNPKNRTCISLKGLGSFSVCVSSISSSSCSSISSASCSSITSSSSISGDFAGFFRCPPLSIHLCTSSSMFF